MFKTTRRAFVGGAGTTAALLTGVVKAKAANYDSGASDTEIVIGHTAPYSGPVSAFGTTGQGLKAYWQMVNDRGGINGRKIRFVTLDDGYSPPKTVELVRQLVERDKVLCTTTTFGTAPNTAIHKYMNQKKVPMLYVNTGASKFADPVNFPWTIGFQPNYKTEAAIYAKHILEIVKDPKVAILYQNDDLGKDYWEGLKQALGERANIIVKATSYEVADTTVDSQLIDLKASGANVFVNVTLGKFAAQSMRRAAELGWKPIQYIGNISAQVSSTLKPAGFENVQGIMTAAWLKDPTDARWNSDEEMSAWRNWLAKYLPSGDPGELSYVYAYAVAFLMEKTLERCGDNLTRENLMREAANHKKLRVPLLLPGITVSTSPADFKPVEALQLQRFEGETWKLFGEVVSSESS